MKRDTLWRAALATGLLAAAATLVGCGGDGRTKEQRDLESQKLNPIWEAMPLFVADCDRYPTEAEGLDALVTNPGTSDIKSRWKGPYLKDPSALTDQFGHKVFWGPLLQPDGQTGMEMWSVGPDGQPYTKDDVYTYQFHVENAPAPWNGRP